MDAAHRPQRLHVRGGERTGEPGVAAAQAAVHVAPREPQLPGDDRGVARGVAQLVGCDADVIRLLREGQPQPMPVGQRAAPCVEHDALGALCPGRGGVATPLEQLHLPGSQHEREQRRTDPDFHHGQANERFGH